MFAKKVKHSGVPIEFGDDTVIVPALTTSQVEGLVEKLMAHDAIKLESFRNIYERLALRTEIVIVALRRNYPEITLEEVREALTTGNSDQAMGAALGTDRTTPRVRELGE